jgi:hypothetical protein
MSLQKVILPDMLIADLYKNIFIISDGVSPKMQTEITNEPASNTVKFLGNNLKKIVIVVRHPADVFLPERHLEFLTKILAACKLNIGDVGIVNEGFKSVDINTLKQQLRPNHIILFGIDPTEINLPLNFPHFKLQNYANTTYLSVPSLDLLNAETEEGKLLKTKLWVCLRTMFEMNGA